MIFHQSSIEAMGLGRKTMTRRLQREGERLVYGHWMWNLVNKKRRGYYGSNARLMGWKEEPCGEWTVPTILDKHGHIKLQVGRRYAIQRGRGKQAVGSHICNSLRGERLQDISTQDLAAEGLPIALTLSDGTVALYDSANEFIELWDGLHGTGERWADNPKVWIIGQGEYEWEPK